MNDLINSFKRTPYQTLASFLILFFTLFLALFFFNLTSFFYGILSYVEGKPQVTVYFQPETAESAIFKTRDEIVNSGKASAVKYVSKEDALKIYRDLNQNNPLLLEMVSAEVLPPSLEIYAKKPEYLSEIAEYLRKQPGINEVEFQKNIVEKLITITNILRKVSMFVFLFLLLIAFIVLMTTTAFKIALKKEEIELLKLLGASHHYIKKPHLIEGTFLGFASGSAAFVVFFTLYLYIQTFLSSYFAGIPNLAFFNFSQYNLYVWPPSAQFVLLSYIATIFFGMIIGFLGNYFSTSKYIR